MDKRILLIIAGVIILGGAIFGIKKCTGKKDGGTVVIEISPDSVNVGVPFKYEDKTEGAENWLWNFGDEGTSESRSGEFTFDKPGKYKITVLVNRKLEGSKEIIVRYPDNTVADEETKKTDVIIQGPAQAFVGEKVTFIDKTPGSTKWEWSFDGTGLVNSTDREATHTFSSPGNKTVSLRTDVNAYAGTHNIKVLMKKSPGGPVNAGPVTEGNFLNRLQGIAAGNYDKHYHILKQMLCNDESIPVTINNGSQTVMFSTYCDKITFENPKISAVKFIRSSSKACIEGLQVTQN